MHFFLQESKAHHVDPSRLIEITKSSDLFKKVFEEQGNDKIQIACCRQMAVKSFNPGEIIIRFGEPAKDFFVILEGRVSIRIPHSRSKPTFDLPRVNEEAKAESNKWNLKNKAMGVVFLNKVLGYETHEEVKILHPGESFGELALISDRPRAATVIAKSKVLLGILSKDVFQKQLARYAEKSLIDKINFLQSLPMFRMRSRLQLMKISYYFSLKKTSWNQFLYKEGEPASALFIVKSGEFMLTKSMSQELKKPFNKHHRQYSQPVDLKLVNQGPGMVLGIRETLAGEKVMRQSAHCVSSSGEVYVISKHDFDSKIFKPEFACIIRDHYQESSEILNKRYEASCRTERVKSSLDFQSETLKENRKKLQFISTKDLETARRDLLKKLVKPVILNQTDRPSEILYNNRRIGQTFSDGKTFAASRTSGVLRSSSSLESNHYSTIFKTTLPEDGLICMYYKNDRNLKNSPVNIFHNTSTN